MMAAPRRQRAVGYGGASGPAALTEYGGGGEAATRGGPGGQFHRHRPTGDVPGGCNGRERGGLPAAGRRDGDAARGPAEGAGGAARGTDRLPGSLFREYVPALACKWRHWGAAGPAPAAAAAPGPRTVAPSPGSPLSEGGLQQQRGRGLPVPERRRAQEEAGAGRAHLQRAAQAHLPRWGGPRGGGGAAAAQDPVPRPRGGAAGRLPRRHAHLLRAAGVRGACWGPLPAASGPRPGRGRPPRGPGRAGHPGGGPAGQRGRCRTCPLPGGRLAAGPRQPGAGHGPRPGGAAAQLPHDPGGVPGEGRCPLHRQGQAGGLSPAPAAPAQPGPVGGRWLWDQDGVSLHAGGARSPSQPASDLE